MAGNILQKYLWLLDKLSAPNGLYLDEIKRLWSKSSISGGKELSERTFHHLKGGIRDTFGIEIECNKYDGYSYRIKDLDKKDRENATFLRTLLMQNRINHSDALIGHVLDMDTAIQDVLYFYMNLIEKRSVIEFHYMYYNEQGCIFLKFSNFLPLSLVRADEYWYIVGVYCSDSGPLSVKDTIAVYKILPGLHNIRILKEHSDYKIDFNLEEFIDNFSIKGKQYDIKPENYDQERDVDSVFYDESERFLESLWHVKYWQNQVLDFIGEGYYDENGRILYEKKVVKSDFPVSLEDWMKR